jgi:hypothetical protein
VARASFAEHAEGNDTNMSSPAATETVDSAPDEDAIVREWRRGQLQRLGFDRADAALLADCAHVDLGRVRALVGGGCELATAMRIVL